MVALSSSGQPQHACGNSAGAGSDDTSIPNCSFIARLTGSASRERNKIEAPFSELKLRVGLRRLRLRRLWNVSEQFYLAATAHNLKRLVRFLSQHRSAPIPCST